MFNFIIGFMAGMAVWTALGWLGVFLTRRWWLIRHGHRWPSWGWVVMGPATIGGWWMIK